MAYTSGTPLVLAVEDQPELRIVLCLSLQGAGFRVLDADSGAAALEQAQRHRASLALALVDRRLPTGSGVLTLGRLASCVWGYPAC